ncbi:MAG: CpaF family protein [Clostridiales bacterium]|nr:CpaF family protein [Clostridiales bacterium]
MSVVSTLKNPLSFYDRASEYQLGSANVSQMIVAITNEILSEKPDIVINANHDDEKSSILRNEIIRLIDRDMIFVSIGREKLVRQIFDAMFGYGLLQPYIEDEDISDIDGTAFNEFSIKKKGLRTPININFHHKEALLAYCKLIAIRNGGILNENDSHCRVADLKMRLRINVSIPPRNINGPAISIRKHRKTSYTMEQLVEENMITKEALEILTHAIKTNKSVVFCGKGASGKTTLMRALINQIDDMERVLIVESDAEIYPDKKFCIEQRVKRDSEGGNSITLEMLIKDGLTMSLDTYCIGEITGSEAYDFIKASCTGHRVLATIHSDKAEDCLQRLVSLAASHYTIESEQSLYKMVAQGIDVIVFLKDFQVKQICQVAKTYDQPLEVLYAKN